MMTRMLALALTITAMSVIACVAQAQSNDPFAETPNSSSDEYNPFSKPKPTKAFRIEFPGGALENYIRHLKRTSIEEFGMDKMLNVVVANNAKDFQLPPIEIQADLTGALKIITACSTEAQEVVLDEDVGGSVYFVRLVSYEEPEVIVVNVKELLKDVDQTALLSSIEIGLEMLGSDSIVTLKLHEETGLLFVKGMKRGTRLVMDVVDQLKSPSAKPLRSTAQPQSSPRLLNNPGPLNPVPSPNRSTGTTLSPAPSPPSPNPF